VPRPCSLLGFVLNNDSVFMNTFRDYRLATGTVLIRCWPYRKNDQSHFEQKKGPTVRRIAGRRRLEHIEPARELACHHARSRLFVNAFLPSFKLAAKDQDGARVRKRYYAPATPRDRLLADSCSSEDLRRKAGVVATIELSAWFEVDPAQT
jgi:hypothetical protein